jgi:hypothetical protein
MNKVITAILTTIFLFIAFWLGEAGKGLFQISPYMVGLIGIISISYLISNNWKYRTISGFTFLILFSVAFFMGDLSFYRAYNSCAEKAEGIRTSLSEFKTKNGNYPAELDKLNTPLPCSRCLRGTILEYESTGSNYRIWFKDWLVEHSATDKEPFLAHK